MYWRGKRIVVNKKNILIIQEMLTKDYIFKKISVSDDSFIIYRFAEESRQYVYMLFGLEGFMHRPKKIN